MALFALFLASQVWDAMNLPATHGATTTQDGACPAE
jgi:hypothetical protein